MCSAVLRLTSSLQIQLWLPLDMVGIWSILVFLCHRQLIGHIYQKGSHILKEWGFLTWLVVDRFDIDFSELASVAHSQQWVVLSCYWNNLERASQTWSHVAEWYVISFQSFWNIG